MFLFFSSRLGCVGSVLLTLALTWIAFVILSR
jgi:hypothetical protein